MTDPDVASRALTRQRLARRWRRAALALLAVLVLAGLFGFLGVKEATVTASAGAIELWTFTRPEGDQLVVDFDGRISPTWHLRAEGSVVVREGWVDVVGVRFTTWNLP